jgi:hypothetical protein
MTTVLWWSGTQTVVIDVGEVTARPFLQGFHSTEKTDFGGGITSYQWTERDARIALPDAAIPAQRVIRLRLMRSGTAHVPLDIQSGTLQMRIGDDIPLGISARVYHILIPAVDELVLHNQQFVTAPQDARELGSAVDYVVLERMSGGLPSIMLLLGWTVIALLHVRIALLVGLRPIDLVLAMIVLLGLFLAAIVFVPAELMLVIPIVIVVAGGLLILSPALVWLMSRLHIRDHAALASMLIFGWFWKGIALSYPGFVATDRQFHVHRMMGFLEGNLFLISMGGGTTFPYPIAGYFTLLPAIALTNELLWTMQIGALIIDSLTVVLLAEWLRGRSERRVAVFAAGIYIMLPVGYIQVFHAPILHIIGQWLSIFYLTQLIRAFRQPDDTVAMWPLVLLALVASLSHFGIFLNLGLMMVLFVLIKPSVLQHHRRALLSYPIGVLLSVVLFYSTAFDWSQAHIGSGSDALQVTKLLSSHAEIVWELLFVRGLWDHFLGVFVVLGVAGIWHAWRQKATPHDDDVAVQLSLAMLLTGALIIVAVATVLFSGTRYLSFVYVPLTIGSALLLAQWADHATKQWAVRVILIGTAAIVLVTWFARFALNIGYWYLL